MNDIKLMNKAADNIRILAASMVEKSEIRSPRWCNGWCRLCERTVFRVPRV